MITMKDFMEVVDYQVTDCSQYHWKCFGDHAHSMDYWDGSHTGKSVHVVFDTKDKIVYQMEAYDFDVNKAIRWTNPDYDAEYRAECLKRGCAVDQAYDDTEFVNLDQEEFLKTAYAIIRKENE